jgi:8-oxo-dGTP pyrophosphatase MutT (NUDIX family)
MQKVFSFAYFESTIEAESLGVDFIPDLRETLTAHCIPLTESGEIIAVNIVGRGVDIPGGHIDENETAIAAMLREAREEAQITADNPRLIDVWRLSSTNSRLGLAQKPYLLLYVAKVVSMEDFNPNEEASERFVLKPEEFISRYFGDKGQARIMVERALTVVE